MWHHDVTNPRTCQFSAVSPCARSRIPISRSLCPATFVSEPKSTHFVEENPNLLVVISTELRMLPNERFCSPSLKRSSLLGNKGHVRDCPYQSMQFLPALSIVLLNYYQLFEKNFCSPMIEVRILNRTRR